MASALVNPWQQVGGAAGTALLSTIALNANKDYLTANASPRMAKQCLQPLVGQMNDVCAAGAVHGYTVSFWVSAGIFAVGAVVAAITVLPGKQAMPGHGDAAAAGAH